MNQSPGLELCFLPDAASVAEGPRGDLGPWGQSTVVVIMTAPQHMSRRWDTRAEDILYRITVGTILTTSSNQDFSPIAFSAAVTQWVFAEIASYSVPGTVHPPPQVLHVCVAHLPTDPRKALTLCY